MKTIKQTFALTMLATCLSIAGAAMGAGNQLQSIAAQPREAGKTEIRLKFSGPVSLPKRFTLENPPRLVFDFPGASVVKGNRQKNVNLGTVKSVEAVDQKNQTRVMVRVDKLVDHSLEVQGDTVVMVFDGSAAAVAPAQKLQPVRSQRQSGLPLDESYAWYHPPGKVKAAKPQQKPMPPLQPVELPPPATPLVRPRQPVYTPPAVTPVAQQVAVSTPIKVQPAVRPAPVSQPRVAAAPISVVPSLQGVDFRREADGGGRVIISLPAADTRVEADKKGNTLNVALQDVDVPADLRKRMDVMDFGTPVSTLDIGQRDMGARIRISANEVFDYTTERHGNQYIVHINKVKVQADSKQSGVKEKKVFTGDKLSLNFQDIEVRAVLQLLADFTNKNIVVSDSVQGSITVRLKDVPWDQALDIVLESKNLGMRENGNVIWVAPAAELEAKEKQELEAIKAKQELEPLVTEYMPINFAKAADMVALIEKSKGEDKQSLLSSRGKVSVDERTNTLLIQDTSAQVKAIRDLVKVLDVPVEQVLIESRIVTASDEFGKQLGARFGVTPMWSNGDSSGIGTGKLSGGTDDYFNSLSSGSSATLPGLSDRLSVNLPVTGAAGSFGFSVLTKDFMVDLELSALQAESKGEIISTPRVITSNQTKAVIEQGVEIPYQQSSSSGATSVSFKKAVLSLEVTPQITPDEHISMDLKVNQDTVGSIYNGVPSINTREVQTKVLVENGQTIVLGGVHEEEKIKGVTKVPVLGDLPVLGNLFRTTNKSNDKRELLIFVTPKIVDGKS